MVDKIERFYRNFIAGWFGRGYDLPVAELNRIEKAIDLAESKVAAEIAFVIDRRLPFWSFIQGQRSADRAMDLFTRMRIWDTEKNNAVLIYLLLAEKDIEILVDRGISKFVDNQSLQSVCTDMEQQIRQSGISDGVIAGIARLVNLIMPHLPDTGNEKNELKQVSVV